MFNSLTFCPDRFYYIWLNQDHPGHAEIITNIKIIIEGVHLNLLQLNVSSLYLLCL